MSAPKEPDWFAAVESFVYECRKALAYAKSLQDPDRSVQEERIRLQQLISHLPTIDAAMDYLRVTSRIDAPSQVSHTDENEALWGTKETASYLSVDVRTIYRYTKEFGLRRMLSGGRLVFRKSDVDAWMETRRRDARRGQRDG